MFAQFAQPVTTVALLAIFGIFMPHGCVVQINTDDGGGSSGGDSTPQTVRIRVINLTTRALDPEIYVSPEVLADPNDLFDESHKFTRLGVGLLGVLGPGDSDTITLDCDEAMMIGTKGGVFGGGDDGNDLSDPAGTGRRIILIQDQSVFCGDRVTFRYRRESGEFTTTFDVEP